MPVSPLKVSDLRKLAPLINDAMRLEVGPMALVERPSPEVLEREALRMATAVTVPSKPKVAHHALSLMLQFDGMHVIPLGASQPEGHHTLGRAADCDVVLSDPSASLVHARVRWDGWRRSAWISDLGSTNGTFVNGVRISRETALAEGDLLSLGDAAFLFVTVETLQALLKQGPA